ncbi:restriction endonuclease subunit S [Dolichospermum planctonicum]|uniref:Type I restriction-modification enzyme S subunit n=1 Tax=Dolichospermum planctonicum TaxID=136072 RepID=A0A480AEH7_9CYAN|nr:restriction endonuclease subunit S [Dolichospermum planctonicum]GCL41511.1 type I restriction-modification enzyme S subunit [Dolichospermum planctonicum]
MEINIKDGYKVTEVGVIPDDWEVKKLGELLKFKNGINADKKYYGEGIKFINILEIIQKRYLFYQDIPGFVTIDSATIKSNLVQLGDILFNRTSETQEEVGLTSVYLDNKDVVFGGFVIRGRPINNLLDYFFSQYAFSSAIVRNQIIKRGQGAIRANIGQSDLKEVCIPLPPLAEQKAIAHALSDVDNLITAIDQLITKKRNLKQGTMQELLTGKKRLPGFSGKWEVKKLGELINSLQNGYGFSARGYIRVGIPIVTMAQIGLDGSFQFDESKVNFWTSSEFESLKNYHLKYGDVIIAMTDVTPSKNLIGRMCQVNRRETFLLNQRVGLLRIDREKINPLFLVALSNLSNTKGWRDYSKSVASLGVQANISTKDILNGTIKIPTIEEQKAIAEILTDMDKEIEALEKKRDKYKTIKQGMMQELLTGKTRIIDN